MAPQQTTYHVPLHALGALLSLLMFLIIGGCGGGTMGTQTGGQRVAVVGTAVDARGAPLANVQVKILNDSGEVIGEESTDGEGRYATEVETDSGSVNVVFTAPGGQTAAASVSVVGATVITVNFRVTGGGGGVVIVPTPTPAPTPSGGGGSTPTPAPPPVATNTPTAIPTAPPPCTTNCDAEATPTPPSDSDAVNCGADAELMSDGSSCCKKSDAVQKICCAPGYAAAGICVCEDGNC